MIHLGYYDNESDPDGLEKMSFKEIIEYYEQSQGKFYVINEEVDYVLNPSSTFMGQVGKYIITSDGNNMLYNIYLITK